MPALKAREAVIAPAGPADPSNRRCSFQAPEDADADRVSMLSDACRGARERLALVLDLMSERQKVSQAVDVADGGGGPGMKAGDRLVSDARRRPADARRFHTVELRPRPIDAEPEQRRKGCARHGPQLPRCRSSPIGLTGIQETFDNGESQFQGPQRQMRGSCRREAGPDMHVERLEIAHAALYSRLPSAHDGLECRIGFPPRRPRALDGSPGLAPGIANHPQSGDETPVPCVSFNASGRSARIEHGLRFRISLLPDKRADETHAGQRDRLRVV